MHLNRVVVVVATASATDCLLSPLPFAKPLKFLCIFGPIVGCIRISFSHFDCDGFCLFSPLSIIFFNNDNHFHHKLWNGPSCNFYSFSIRMPDRRLCNLSLNLDLLPQWLRQLRSMWRSKFQVISGWVQLFISITSTINCRVRAKKRKTHTRVDRISMNWIYNLCCNIVHVWITVVQ